MEKLLIMLLCLMLALGAVPAMAQEEAPYVHEGISRVSASVFSLEESVNFFTKTMGLELVCEGDLDEQVCKALYDMPCAAKYAMLKNAYQDTLLQLIEFAQTPTQTSREGYNSWDYGYYDIAFRCADIQACFKDLTAQGYKFLCEPYSYTTTWSGATVFEAVLQGPNGMPLALINKTESTPEFEGMFRNFPDVVLVVDDIATADRFYTDVLGIQKGFDMEMEPGLVDPIVGTAGTDITTRIAMYVASGATPVIEILSYSEEGRPMRLDGAMVPAKAGTFATAFRTEVFDEVMAKCDENGFPVVYGPLEMTLAPYGQIRTALISGPNGTFMEIFEVLG